MPQELHSTRATGAGAGSGSGSRTVTLITAGAAAAGAAAVPAAGGCEQAAMLISISASTSEDL